MSQIGLFESVDYIIGSLGILLVEIVGDFDERVGSAAHGREHHDFGFTVAGDEFADILHTLGRAYARASEFENFHAFFMMCLVVFNDYCHWYFAFLRGGGFGKKEV